MLVYPAGMNVSPRVLRFVSDALREHRRTTRTRWRVLSSGRQALMVLAAMAPTLEQAMHSAAAKAYVILDGTLLRIDRVAMASRR